MPAPAGSAEASRTTPLQLLWASSLKSTTTTKGGTPVWCQQDGEWLEASFVRRSSADAGVGEVKLKKGGTTITVSIIDALSPKHIKATPTVFQAVRDNEVACGEESKLPRLRNFPRLTAVTQALRLCTVMHARWADHQQDQVQVLRVDRGREVQGDPPHSTGWPAEDACEQQVSCGFLASHDCPGLINAQVQDRHAYSTPRTYSRIVSNSLIISYTCEINWRKEEQHT